MTFQDDLQNQLEEIGAYIPDRQSNGKVSRQTIKAYFESDYTIAYQVRNRKIDLVYLSDGDMTTLCGPNAICICSFRQEKGSRKKRKDGENVVFVYEVTGGSNTLMDEIKAKINTILPSSKIIYKEAKYPIFEQIIPRWIRMRCLSWRYRQYYPIIFDNSVRENEYKHSSEFKRLSKNI